MNQQLLNQICEVILEEPKRLHMWHWASSPLRSEGITDFPECGTVACIYGWAKALSTGLRANELAYKVAALVRASVDEEDQPDLYCKVLVDGAAMLDITMEEAGRLFYARQWPPEFRDKIEAPPGECGEWWGEEADLFKPGTLEYAQNAVDRIKYFMEHRL